MTTDDRGAARREGLPAGPREARNRQSLAEREVLRVVVEAYPQALTADAIASRTNPPYQPTGGGFRGAVSKLRTLGLIEGRGELRGSEDLFS
jgi:hypothetical protein